MAVSTVDIKDAAGTTRTVNTLAVGAAAKAAAHPTLPASDLDNIEPAGVPITGATMPTGGVGITGWLSAIWSKLGGVVLGAGSALIGKVSIDQTTPGTTNAVAIIDGGSVSVGAKADAAANNSTSAWSVIALLKGIYALCAAATPAGTNIIGSILGRTSSVTVSPTVSTTAYSAGDCIGGIMTFASALDASFTGILQSVVVRAKSIQTANLKLYLFSANPGSSTFVDNTAASIASTDLSKLIGCFPLGLADNGLNVMTIWESDGIAAAIKSASTSLYAVLVTTSAPTLASTSDISVELRVLKD